MLLAYLHQYFLLTCASLCTGLPRVLPVLKFLIICQHISKFVNFSKAIFIELLKIYSL